MKGELEAIRPMPGVFYPEYVRRLNGTHLKTGKSKAEMVEQLRADIRRAQKERGCSRAVGVWCGSTEVYAEPSAVHASIRAFEAGLLKSDPAITNSQMYAWAFLHERGPLRERLAEPRRRLPRSRPELARGEPGVAVAGKWDFSRPGRRS